MAETERNICPSCEARNNRESVMFEFHRDILSFLRANRQAKLDSCIKCVEKHVSRAMTYAAELLTANGSGMADGTARVNVYLDYLKVLGHLGCAIEESEDFTELHSELIKAERLYRYEGIEPDWSALSESIKMYKAT